MLWQQQQRQKDDLHEAAGRMKECVQGPWKENMRLEIEHYAQDQEAVLNIRYAAVLQKLRQSSREQVEALEKCAQGLVVEYKQKKTAEDHMREQYSLQKVHLDNLMKSSPEVSQLRTLMQVPRLHRDVL